MAEVKTKAVGGGIAAVVLGGALALAAPIIQRWEGVRYEPYQDSVGVWTVCYGHTKTVDRNKAYTRAECDELLRLDRAEANGYVRQCIGVPMLRQIEAARVAMTRHIKRGGKVWIRIFPDVPVTDKPAEVRMGKGKGSPEYWACRVKPGRIMFELDGVAEDVAREALRLGAAKLPIKTRFVQRIAE